MKREPVLIITTVIILLQVVVVLLVVLLTNWSKEEIVSVIGVIATSLNLAAAFFVRSLVTPTAGPRDNDGNTLHASKM